MDRAERMLENQQTSRYANERLQEKLVVAGITDHRHVPFFCECADGDCRERLEATLDEFEEAHLSSDYYFILPGHLTLDGETAIEQNGRYEVVTKENV
jgi:hypothetical protein